MVFTEEEIYELIGRMPTYTDIFNAAYKLGEESSKSKWHKVSEEGLPTEEGLYAFYFGEFENVLPNEKSVYSPIYEIGFVYKTLPISRKLVAWQKITPYKEG